MTDKGSRTKSRSKSRSKSKSRVRKSTKELRGQLGELVHDFMRLLVELKIYHWSTTSFARHKASDQCFTDLQGLVDRFMEAVLGASGARAAFTAAMKQHSVLNIPLNRSMHDAYMERQVRQLIETLQRVTFTRTELANIRDEILSALRTCLYLFTLN